jgi:hypothetical protein
MQSSQIRQPETLDAHIDAKRLFDVATRDEKHFGLIELDHLKECNICIDRFATFVHQKTKQGRRVLR